MYFKNGSGSCFLALDVTQHWMETRSAQTPPGVELSWLNSVRKKLKQGKARLVSCTHPPPCLISNKNISTHWKASDAIEPLVLQTTKEQTKWVAKITGLQIQRSNYIIKHIQPDITCCCHQSST